MDSSGHYWLHNWPDRHELQDKKGSFHWHTHPSSGTLVHTRAPILQTKCHNREIAMHANRASRSHPSCSGCQPPANWPPPRKCSGSTVLSQNRVSFCTFNCKPCQCGFEFLTDGNWPVFLLVYLHLYLCLNLHLHLQLYLHLYLHMYLHLYFHLCAFVPVRISIWIYTYISTSKVATGQMPSNGLNQSVSLHSAHTS